ncbi:MAG: 1-acyl-sn-glycerol-3-phosphate acyltransferase [Clostridia bacterium]|nr:1-acyl-sn-glycerol-3-phosphate acyltransferase [Clostridia bacterium]
MKIKTRNVSTEYVLSLQEPKKRPLKKPSFLFQTLVRIFSIPDLIATKFTYTKERMEQAGKGPYLVLMNHSSFIDLKIASKILYPKPYYIVSTTDALVGKEWLMRKIGCIPTRKFTADVSLLKNMLQAVKEKKVSVLMFPEAGYSFDGRTTTLPSGLGSLLKKLDVPVISVITEGAFLRQPLYNNLKLRKVKVSARVNCLLTREEIAEKSVEELDGILEKTFSFDNFKTQFEKRIVVDAPDRAEGLNRVLYRCPHCRVEGKMLGEGVTLKCQSCGKEYVMDEYGSLQATEGETEFSHIPDWYEWQRECVIKELEDDSYKMELDVDVAVIADYKALYTIGKGKLVHTKDGFTLESEDKKIRYEHSPLASYGLNADYAWYEMGDTICVGDKKRLYYCFPTKKDVVTKARFATEEIYKRLKGVLKEK